MGNTWAAGTPYGEYDPYHCGLATGSGNATGAQTIVEIRAQIIQTCEENGVS